MATSNNTIIGIVVVIVLVAAAGWYLSSSAHAGYNGGSASATFTLADAPPSLGAVSAVYVTVQNLSIHSATTGQWYVVAAPQKTYNLVSLKSSAALMGNVTLPSGLYNEISLSVTAVNVVVNAVTNTNVKLPSSNLKIFGNFNMTATANTPNTNWVSIDFKANQSLHATGNGVIIMLPVLETRLYNNAQVAAGVNGTAFVNTQGSVTADVNDGMNVNGTMQTNYVVPQNANLTVNANGGIGIGAGVGAGGNGGYGYP